MNRLASTSAEALDPDNSNNEVAGVVNVANDDDLPEQIKLYQNFPNPFGKRTHISFELSTPKHVKLVVYDMLGREVLRLYDQMAASGEHSVSLDANALASGIYVYKFEAGSYAETRQMVVIR